MTEVFVLIAIILVGSLALAEVSRRTAAKNQDIARKLLGVENSLTRSRNYLAMSKMTPHGEADRATYIQMVEVETYDAIKLVRQLKKDVYGA